MAQQKVRGQNKQPDEIKNDAEKEIEIKVISKILVLRGIAKKRTEGHLLNQRTQFMLWIEIYVKIFHFILFFYLLSFFFSFSAKLKQWNIFLMKLKRWLKGKKRNGII